MRQRRALPVRVRLLKPTILPGLAVVGRGAGLRRLERCSVGMVRTQTLAAMVERLALVWLVWMSRSMFRGVGRYG